MGRGGADHRMNYSSMEQMASAFKQAASQLGETQGAMENVAKAMEDGGLLGTAGDAFRDAIRSKLNRKLKKIQEKMQELERDINGAVSATRDGVKTAQSRFK